MKKKLKLIIPVFILLSIPVYFTFIQKIYQISCHSEKTDCKQELNDKLNGIIGNRHFLAKKKVNNILKNEPIVENYSIRFQLPDEIIINITEHKPVFALADNNNEKFALLTKDGFVVSIEDNNNLPSVHTEHLPEQGKVVDSGVLFSFEMLKALQTYYQITDARLVDNNGFLIETDSGLQGMLPLNGDKEVLLGSVLVVFNRLNSVDEKSIIDKEDSGDESKICENKCLVDFRFRNPIIKNII